MGSGSGAVGFLRQSLAFLQEAWDDQRDSQAPELRPGQGQGDWACAGKIILVINTLNRVSSTMCWEHG